MIQQNAYHIQNFSVPVINTFQGRELFSLTVPKLSFFLKKSSYNIYFPISNNM